MKTIKARAVMLAASVLLALGTTACIGFWVGLPSPRRHVIYVDEQHPRTLRTYYYYPSAEVYFEPGAHVYYWREGGAWRSGPQLPPDIVLSEEGRVKVETDAEHPYDIHEKIVQHAGDTRYEEKRIIRKERVYE